MTLCDAGPLIAIIDADERDHDACLAALDELALPLVTTWPAFTAPVDRFDGDGIAFRNIVDAGSDSGDGPGELVSHDRPRRDRRRRQHVEVGAADAAEGDVDSDLARTGLGIRQLALGEPAILGDLENTHE